MLMRILLYKFILIVIITLFTQCDTSKKLKPSDNSVSETVKPVIALDGRKLYPPQESETTRNHKDSLRIIAQQNFDSNPDSLEYIIWLGRRVAYQWRYFDAIKIFTQGLQKHPNSPELYRHRGHRYLSTRQLSKAVADFEKAAGLVKGRPIQIEPDGIPNKINMPLSNLQFNIWYHWALAYYLQGNFEKAAELYEACMNYTLNADLIVANVDWLYMTYKRLGNEAKANQWLRYITTDMKIVENESYFNRLLMYKGKKHPSELLDLETINLENQLDLVTQGYGVGNWYYYNDEQEIARSTFEKILSTNYWSAFGYLAAEADLLRFPKKGRK